MEAQTDSLGDDRGGDVFGLSVWLVAGTPEPLVMRLSVGLLLINLLIVWAVQRA